MVIAELKTLAFIECHLFLSNLLFFFPGIAKIKMCIEEVLAYS